MSSEEEVPKKRKIQRACDACRRRKTKCDGPQKADNVCTTCLTNSIDCTYKEASQKRAPPKAYVQALESRLEKMEALLQRLCPEGDFSQELDGYEDQIGTFARPGPSQKALVPPSATSPFLPTSPHHHDAGDQSSDDEVPDFLKFATEGTFDPISNRYFGKSAATKMIRRAVEMKSELTGGPLGLHGRRPEYWHVHSWERQAMHRERRTTHIYIFPELDLLRTLMNAFFSEINTLWPLLHRPSFEQSVAEGMHLNDEDFASILLLVCAVASRLIDDPRVLVDGSPSLSAGWKYFNEVHLDGPSLLTPPSLADLQIRCLSVMFLQGSSAPQAGWSIIGVGIRMAQDVGAHRRKMYGEIPCAEKEQWKRAFWMLVVFDRAWSSALGRSCAIQDEDFDLDMPVECDDEYWEPSGSRRAFEQPSDRPSRISYFIWTIKLQQIVSFALRTLYSINKSKVSLGFVGPEWEQKIVAELQTALDTWMRSIPDHLRWDPERTDGLFFHQSALLRSAYHIVRVMIYRPFIAYPDRDSPLTRSAFAICTNASRECSRVLEAHQRRRREPLLLQTGAAFTSAIILLLSLWGGKRDRPATTDLARDMQDIYTCMDILKRIETKWHIAGRMWDDLWELASVNGLPLPVLLAACHSQKADSESSTAELSSPSMASPPCPLWPLGTEGFSTNIDPHALVSSRLSSSQPDGFSGVSIGRTSAPSWSSVDSPTVAPTASDAPAMSEGEIAAWLNAPLGWQSEEWHTWVTDMSATTQ